MPDQATNATTAAAVSAVNSEPSQTLKALGRQLAVDIGLAVATIVALAIPVFTQAAVPLLPDSIEVFIGGTLLTAGLTARAWLTKRIMEFHKREKVEALLKPTPEPVFPPEIDRFYKR